MIPEISPFRDLLSNRLAKAQNAQFHYEMVSLLSPLVENISALSIVWPAYIVEANHLEALVAQSRKMFNTKYIAEKDSSRDFVTRAIMHRITDLYMYPLSDDEKEEGAKLFFIVNEFKGAVRKEYQSEIAYIRAFIAGLRKFPELLDKYKLTPIVDKLEVENNEFEDLYNERSMEYAEQQIDGDIKPIRRSSNKAFSNVCKVIEGLILTPIADDLYKELEHIIMIMNGYIDEYTVKYHRHAGVVKAQKKKKENAKGENNDKADKDNSEDNKGEDEAGKEKPKDDKESRPGAET